MEKLNVTAEEFEAFELENDVLSDVDMTYNEVTKEYDVPSIEWDGMYGRHWQKFESEEALKKALEAYDKRLNEWVMNYRKNN